MARDRPEQDRRVLHRARHRADLVERAGKRDQAVARNAAVRRLQAHDPAQRGRLADRAAGVGAQRRRAQARRHRRRAAAAAATGDARQIPGVMRGMKPRIFARRAHRELVHVELAEENGARVAQPGDRGRVVGRDEVFEHPRGARRRRPARAHDVLQAERHAQQRPAFAVFARRVGGVGLRERLVLHEPQVCACLAVDRLDPVIIGLGQFARRNLARIEERLDLPDREGIDGNGHGCH